MLDSLTLVGLSAGTKVLVDNVLLPLTKEATKDFYKDFLKQSASRALYEQIPKILKNAIIYSQKDFLELFQEELEYCNLPGELAGHQFSKPLKSLLEDVEVKRFLGMAFDIETKQLDSSFLQAKWALLSVVTLPTEFDWEQLTKNYLRRVKGLIREDVELARQLELDCQERMLENTVELVGIPVDFNLGKYQESLKEKFGNLSLESLDTDVGVYYPAP